MIQRIAEIKRTIADILQVSPETIQYNLNLKTDLGLDSMDIVELVVDVEKRFGVLIPDNRTVELVTVADLTKEIAQAPIPEN